MSERGDERRELLRCVIELSRLLADMDREKRLFARDRNRWIAAMLPDCWGSMSPERAP